MASNTPVRWVASDRDGLPLKRKQVSQACAICRKRKKRCVHVRDGPDDHVEQREERSTIPGSSSPAGQAWRTALQSQAGLPESPSSSDGYHATEEEDATQVAANHLVELSSSRFVGDLNPEGFFIQAATPTLPATRSSYRDSNDLGVWLPPGELTDGKPVGVTDPTRVPSNTPHRSHGVRSSTLSAAAVLYQRAKRSYIKECLAVVPPASDYAVLHRIYCEMVHPLFPVLNESDLFVHDSPASVASAVGASVAASSSAVYPAVVKQVIALAASQIDKEAAAPHLRLEENGPLLSARDFHSRIADAAATVVGADTITSRFGYVRIMILMAFFYQPSNEGDRNQPALFCNHAVHHFHTLGAHLQGYRPQRPEDDVERTFCALWALDRFCSVFYARPCLMHAQDLGKNIEECVAKQPPCFRLFMTVVMWLDRIIQLYRPRQSFILIDIPVFESMILDAEAEKIPAMHIGTIEVLYHTVCVLSCRQPVSAFSDTPLKRDRAYLPLSIINPRRSHSTDRIIWVTQTQPICCFPFVPYAVSLALSVQYKKLRYSRTPMFRTRARACFKDIVKLLKSMSDVFLSVRVNAALGDSILTQMEKTASTLAREELENTQQSRATIATRASGTTTVANTAANTAATANATTAIAPPSTLAAAPAVDDPTVVSAGASTTAASSVVASSSADNPSLSSSFVAPKSLAANHSILVRSALNDNSSEESSIITGTATVAQAVSVEGTGQDFRSAVGPIPPPANSTLFDLSMLDSLGTDVDLFSNFDPSFDLGAVDTALEANLDMGIPQNWAPWSHIV